MILFRVGKVWHYRFQVAGKRVQKSTGVKIKGQAEALALVALSEAKQRSRGEEPMLTLGKLKKAWLETHSATVSAGHWRNVNAWDSHGMDDAKMDRLTTELVELARGKHLEGRSPASANLWMRTLNLLGNWAIKRGILDTLPWRVKMQKVQKTPRKTLPVDKALEWLHAAEGHGRKSNKVALGIVLRLMLGLGMREGEALGARWEWLDWDRKTYTPGKTKGKEADAIPCPGWLMDCLKPHKADLGLIIGDPHPTGFTRKAIAFANQECKTPGLSPHRLRGTFATLHSEAGTPVQTIQRMLRHKDVKTTMAYLESHTEQAREQQEEIGKRLGFA